MFPTSAAYRREIHGHGGGACDRQPSPIRRTGYSASVLVVRLLRRRNAEPRVKVETPAPPVFGKETLSHSGLSARILRRRSGMSRADVSRQHQKDRDAIDFFVRIDCE
jgi:hypothetical protein